MFVTATGHVTTAELDGNALTFTPRAGRVELGDPAVVVARRRCLLASPRRTATSGGDHPVVQVSFADALAYCTLAGARLPTEVEWEAAAQDAVVGNVWEWTSTTWTRDHQPVCCSAPASGEMRVAKRGSFLWPLSTAPATAPRR